MACFTTLSLDGSPRWPNCSIDQGFTIYEPAQDLATIPNRVGTKSQVALRTEDKGRSRM
jgi:hypothetical protein